MLWNGYAVVASHTEIGSVVMATTRGELEMEAIGIWLRQWTIALKAP